MNAPNSSVLTMAVSQYDETSENIWNTVSISQLLISQSAISFNLFCQVLKGHYLFLYYLRIAYIKNLVRLRLKQVHKSFFYPNTCFEFNSYLCLYVFFFFFLR